MTENGHVCSSETVTGGENVFSCNESDVSSADHLVVMINGILGSSADWKFAAEQFVKSLPDKVFVHRSERNAASQTLDGVDVMGERLSEEVLEVIKQKPNLRKISFVAHSTPKEYTDDTLVENCEEAKPTIGGLIPVNFITVATPHLGSRGNKQVPFLFGLPALEKAAVLVIHWIFRRTGRHLFLTDNDEGKPPLLKRMLEDYDDCYFMSALRSFQRRVTYANVGYDHIVGWRTSSIRRNIELPKWQESVNEKYPHVVYEERCKGFDFELDSTNDDNADDVEEELVTGLSRVSWEKVDVSFHNSKSRFAAHSVIQVKNHNLHTDGADVIQHMIDHFCL
ncbi:putative alpha/Beta hydrolase, lipase [Helianthus annuus]|nr:putative alpha/Beta hydrolase, lipase [Helianthus annuus]